MNRGRLITIEGIDGAGKTTLAAGLLVALAPAVSTWSRYASRAASRGRADPRAGDRPRAARHRAYRGAALRRGPRAARRGGDRAAPSRRKLASVSTGSSTPRWHIREAAGSSGSTRCARSTSSRSARPGPIADAAADDRPGARPDPFGHASGGARSSRRENGTTSSTGRWRPISSCGRGPRPDQADRRLAPPGRGALGGARGARRPDLSSRSGALARTPRRRRPSLRSSACLASSRARIGSASLAATGSGGSPGPLARLRRAISRPVTVAAAAMTSRTENPLPLPRLNTRCWDERAPSSASRWASARSSTWM